VVLGLNGCFSLDSSLLVDQLRILTWCSPSKCWGHYFRYLSQEWNSKGKVIKNSSIRQILLTPVIQV
jgi:hypothetical protein